MNHPLPNGTKLIVKSDYYDGWHGVGEGLLFSKDDEATVISSRPDGEDSYLYKVEVADHGTFELDDIALEWHFELV